MASVFATTAVTTAAPFLQNIKIAAQQLKPLVKEFQETVKMTTDEIKDVVVTVKEAEQDITNAVTSVDNQGKLNELQSNLQLEEAKKNILKNDVSPSPSSASELTSMGKSMNKDYINNTASELTSMGKDYINNAVSNNIPYNDIANSVTNMPTMNNQNFNNFSNPDTNAATNTIPLYQGGKKNSLKQIQKGGRMAANRTRKSINEFLNSSVTSSYIYDMVQNNMTKKGGKMKQKRKSKRNKKRGNGNKRSLKRLRRR